MNDTTMLRFRESFRGYNKDDVNAYIEQIHMKFTRRESELRAQMAEVQQMPCQNGANDTALARDLEAAKEALASAEARNHALMAELEALKANVAASEQETAEKSKLYDSMSAQVGNILIVANSNADQILRDAKAEADKLKADAVYEAEKTRQEAEEKLNGMIRALEAKLATVSERCLAEYEALVTEAGHRFGEITETMKNRSCEFFASADRKTRELEKQITSEYSASDAE